MVSQLCDILKAIEFYTLSGIWYVNYISIKLLFVLPLQGQAQNLAPSGCLITTSWMNEWMNKWEFFICKSN